MLVNQFMSTKLTTFNIIRSTLNEKAINLSVNVNQIKSFINHWSKKIVPEYNTKIVTMIGPTQGGKSTFLNAVVSYCKNQYMNPFERVDLKDRRIIKKGNEQFSDQTSGLDGYVCVNDNSKTNFIFIDVMGLFGSASECDPIIMLFCYAISDLIIFNAHHKIDIQQLLMFNYISNNINIYMQLKEINKPAAIFRIFDSATQSDEDAKIQFNTMMDDRNDSCKIIRGYFKNLFNWDNNFIWSVHPDQSILDQLHKDNNMSSFITSNKSYQKSCINLLELLFKMPKKQRNILKELIDAAEFVNKEFSKVDICSIEIKLSDEMSNWISEMKAGKYAEIFEPIGHLNYSNKTYPLLKNREEKIAECKAEFKRFEHDINYNYALNKIFKPIDEAIEDIHRTINTHISLLIDHIRDDLKDRLFIDNECISIINLTWCNKSKFNQIIGESLTDIAFDLKCQIINDFNKQYQEIENKFSVVREKFINNIKTTIEQCRNEIQNDKKDYSSRLNLWIHRYELSLSEITDILLHKIQLKYNLILDNDLVKQTNKLIEDKELKESKISTSHLDLKMYMSVDITYFKLVINESKKIDIVISELSGLQDLDITNYCNNIILVFNDFRNTCLGYKSKFDNLRKKAIGEYLTEINQKTFEERCEIFEKIKHNDLYMFNFTPNNISMDSYKLFRSIDENNLIYTSEQFNQKFCDNVRSLYKAYKSSLNENERNFARNEIWRFWALDNIGKNYK